MQLLDGRLVHAASDLNDFSECVHLVGLSRRVADGRLARPQRDDPTAALLARKGDEHERRHLERLRAIHGDRLVAFEERPAPSRAGYAAAEAASIAAMAAGAPIIYQATFFDGTFLGRADFLERVERPCARWQWSYEVVDTKLALSPKPYFLIQLCHYSEHVERITGTAPERASIVLGSGEHRAFPVADYAAYYRHLKASYLAAIAEDRDAYPFECAHCDLCAWRDACAQRRDRDDHLSLVAGIRRDQIGKLEDGGVTTLSELATAPDRARPARLASATFAHLRAQAAEQHRYRRALSSGAGATHSYTFRPATDTRSGFARLPEPDPGDIFFDIEGDPMYRPDRPLEYLFGIYLPHEDRYEAFWGTTPADERRAFESFVDFVLSRRSNYPGLHIYHYAPYEPTALKRLMGRLGSREDAIDGLLRARTFVDLYPVVRQSLWISQPSYSIKKVEALYGFERHTQTRGGDDSIVMFESWLESRDQAILDDIQAYNEDDCRSTHALREWLVRLRAERNAQNPTPIPWFVPPEVTEPLETTERTMIEAALLDGAAVPESEAELRAAPDGERARWLLGNLLRYHQREQKPEWWEYFHRLEHPEDLIEADHRSLGGLEHCADIPSYPKDRSRVHTFSFPPQEHDMRAGTKALDGATGKHAGQIVALDDLTRRLEIKLSNQIEPSALKALIPTKPPKVSSKRETLETIAREYLAGTLGEQAPATLGLLLAERPRFNNRRPGERIQPTQVTPPSLSALVSALDGSFLIVQGPPGSGKSTLGAHVVVDLLAAGKRVALAALSHKALHALLRKIEHTAAERGVAVRGCHKNHNARPDTAYSSAVGESSIADAPQIADFAGYDLVSATTFGWAEPSLRKTFDVLVIDEAGQVSLADALATSLVARDVVLLGDPQQLPQVAKGSHPIGVDRSILGHLLGPENTIPIDRGVFLDRSYRMQPEINAFVSASFYDGRLAADDINVANAVHVDGHPIAGPLYRFIDHDGDARRARAEADAIVDEIVRLLAIATVTIRDRAPRALAPGDILIVTPYNSQRALIEECLARRNLATIAVGTVDKFQGQEAPVVFFSMTTSSAELAPRGLEFLINPNRFNVAISRAQALCVVVCSPHLPAARATTIEQMRLVNLLCAYIEACDPHASGATRVSLTRPDTLRTAPAAGR